MDIILIGFYILIVFLLVHLQSLTIQTYDAYRRMVNSREELEQAKEVLIRLELRTVHFKKQFKHGLHWR